VFLSVRNEDKSGIVSVARKLKKLGFSLVATRGTAEYLKKHGLAASVINKVRDGSPHVVDGLLNGSIHIVINTPEGTGPLRDSRSIRSTATELSLPLFTTLAAARAMADGIEQWRREANPDVRTIQEYLQIVASN